MIVDLLNSLTETLKNIPSRELLLYLCLAGVLFLYFKLTLMVADRLQKENQRLVEEKRWLWDQLKLNVPKTGISHYSRTTTRKKK